MDEYIAMKVIKAQLDLLWGREGSVFNKGVFKIGSSLFLKNRRDAII
jgi:hypothetical protein